MPAGSGGPARPKGPAQPKVSAQPKASAKSRVAAQAKATAGSTGTGPPRPQYPIESVDNALRLLLMFADRGEIRLSEAREALGVAQSTAHRLMAMLAYHDFVRQDPGSRAYRAGPALIDVGLSVVRAMDIRAIARPFLEDLMQQVGETVHLATLEGPGARFLDAVESEHALRVAGRTGRVLPAHATSVGKAMLAALPDAEIDRIYPSETLPAQTTRTITAKSALRTELARVRKRGYASNAGESEDGVSSIGVAVVNSSGRPVAAVSVAAPVSRMSAAMARQAAVPLAETARQISAGLF
jgi:IclR family acetate operon transcriptional repressor